MVLLTSELANMPYRKGRSHSLWQVRPSDTSLRACKKMKNTSLSSRIKQIWKQWWQILEHTDALSQINDVWADYDDLCAEAYPVVSHLQDQSNRQWTTMLDGSCIVSPWKESRPCQSGRLNHSQAYRPVGRCINLKMSGWIVKAWRWSNREGFSCSAGGFISIKHRVTIIYFPFFVYAFV